MLTSFFLSLLVVFPASAAAKSAAAKYAPERTQCPDMPLVRPANGLSVDEEAYRTKRKAFADDELREWILDTSQAFEIADDLELPTVGLLPKHD